MFLTAFHLDQELLRVIRYDPLLAYGAYTHEDPNDTTITDNFDRNKLMDAAKRLDDPGKYRS